jgi:hypothetical protein
VASATYALDPQVMGIAPAFAIPKALKRAGLAPENVDVWEIHEAYAAEALGVLRELPRRLDGFEIPDERLNGTAYSGCASDRARALRSSLRTRPAESWAHAVSAADPFRWQRRFN